MNLLNTNDYEYRHSFDGHIIVIPAGEVLQELNGLQVEHFTKHNAGLKLISDEEALAMASGDLVLEDEPPIIAEEPAEEEELECEECGKVCATKPGLISHQKTHVSS